MVLPVAYLESSNPTEKERDDSAVVPEKSESLEKTTGGWTVALMDRETADGDRSQDADGSEAAMALDGAGVIWRGGVSLNTERSPSDSVEAEDPDNKSLWL